MKSKTIISALAAAVLVIGCASEKHHHAKAKISKEQAEQIALEKVPGGSIKEGELEKEHGKLIWSFDIAKAGMSGITEVQVNAVTGEIVSVEQESAADEAKEKAKEEKEEKERK